MDEEPIIETVQIDADDSLARSKLQGFQEFMQSWGKKLTIAGAMIGALGGTVQAALSKAADSLASQSASLTSKAADYKVTTQELERMQFQAQQTGQSLSDMAKSGGASAEWAAAADAMGVVLSPEAVAAGLKLSRAMELVKDQVRYLWMNIGAHVVPGLTQFAQITSTVLATAIRWARENGPLIQTISKIATAAVVVGGALTGVGSVMWGIGAAVGWLTPIVSALGGALVTFLVSPMGMVAVAVAAGVGALLYFSGAARNMAAGVAVDFGGMLSQAIAVLRQLYEFVSTTVNAVKTALAAGDMALASQVAWAAVKMVWYKGVSELVGVVQMVLGGDWVQSAINGLASGWTMLETGFNNAVTGMKNMWDTFLTWLGNAADMAVNEIVAALTNAYKGLGAMVAKLPGASRILGITPEKMQKEAEFATAILGGASKGRIEDRSSALDARIAERNTTTQAENAKISEAGGSAAAIAEAMRAAVGDASESVAGFGDSFREALDKATEEWRAGVEASGQLPGALPGMPGTGAGAGTPDEVRRSVVGTFSGAAAGLLGGSANGLDQQQLSQQTRAANGIDRIAGLIERNPGAVYT
jgi:hypothetical protein